MGDIESFDVCKNKDKDTTIFLEHPTWEIASLFDVTFGHHFCTSLLNATFILNFCMFVDVDASCVCPLRWDPEL